MRKSKNNCPSGQSEFFAELTTHKHLCPGVPYALEHFTHASSLGLTAHALKGITSLMSLTQGMNPLAI